MRPERAGRRPIDGDECLAHFGAYLERFRPDRGPQPRQHARRIFPEGGDGILQHAGGEPAPAGMGDCNARSVLPAQEYGQAVGREDHRHPSRPRGDGRIRGDRRGKGSVPSIQVATAVPCTCTSHAGTAGRCAWTARRLAATRPESSPHLVPRLSVPCSPSLTPPSRVVTNARTRAGAGQSGSSQLAGRFIDTRSAATSASKSAGGGAVKFTSLRLPGCTKASFHACRAWRGRRLAPRPP